ncbi:hypothetical protein Ddc_00745 [Ditylenchus destructor]|nr:hypothetical protein Ddc_00745 [Ditylenchus destructor]
MPSNDEQKSAKDRSTMEISSKWTPYLAGDQVAAILANQPIFLMNKAGHYPCPLPTTERGVLEMSFQDR